MIKKRENKMLEKEIRRYEKDELGEYVVSTHDSNEVFSD